MERIVEANNALRVVKRLDLPEIHWHGHRLIQGRVVVNSWSHHKSIVKWTRDLCVLVWTLHCEIDEEFDSVIIWLILVSYLQYGGVCTQHFIVEVADLQDACIQVYCQEV